MKSLSDPNDFTSFDVSLHNSLNNTNLFDLLMNEGFYEVIRSNIIASEDNNGDYDYSNVSNLGMVYLFLHRKKGKRSQRTKIEYARELIQFHRHITNHDILDFREMKRSQIESYQQWIEGKYPKKKTQAKKITILSSFLSWCFGEKYLKRDLSRGLYGVSLDKTQIPDREISPASLHAAIMQFEDDPKFKFLFLLLPSTGLRINEIITPKWKNLYFDSHRKKYYLRTITKRGGERHAHIKEYILKELIEYRKRLGLSILLDPADDSPFFPNRYKKHYSLTSLSAMVSKKLAIAGLQTIHNQKTTAHYFRHYFARAAFNSGASVDRIAKTLDHATSKTTEDNYLARDIRKENDVSELVVMPGFEEELNHTS